MRVIVEVDKDVQAVGQVLVDLAGGGQEGLGWVAAAITAPVKAEVGPVGGEALRMVRDTVMNAEGRRRAPEDGVDFVTEPARITKLNGPAVVTGGRLKKAGQTREIRRPVRWQLHQNRAQARAEPPRPVEESRDHRVRLFEALQMRAIAAEFQRIAEVWRGLLPPPIKALRLGEMVEGVVDFHSIKVTGVVGNPVLLREWPGVEDLLPVGIGVAGRADT